MCLPTNLHRQLQVWMGMDAMLVALERSNSKAELLELLDLLTAECKLQYGSNVVMSDFAAKQFKSSPLLNAVAPTCTKTPIASAAATVSQPAATIPIVTQ